MTITIREDDPKRTLVRVLLETHLALMQRISPPESVHALDLDGLTRPEITFWTAGSGDDPFGCVALKALTPEHGEIKSMHVAEPYRRAGIARLLVEHILTVAKSRGYRRLSLETGSDPEFQPARSLYARYGFVETGPFEGYVEDPHSTFMTLTLTR